MTHKLTSSPQQAMAQDSTPQIMPSLTPDQINEIAIAVSKNLMLCHKEVLSIDEVAQYTGLKLSYIYKLTSQNEIPHSKPTGKSCFFRRVEIEEWLMSNPVATETELNTRAMEYLKRNPAPRPRP